MQLCGFTVAQRLPRTLTVLFSVSLSFFFVLSLFVCCSFCLSFTFLAFDVFSVVFIFWGFFVLLVCHC